MVDRTAIMELIKRLGENDLIFLNKLIVERLKLIAQAKSTHHMARFNVGDRVEFQTLDGKNTGIVVRLNKKTVSIKLDDGSYWNVSPMYLIK